MKRNARQIKAWMILNDITAMDIARALGVSHSLVSYTINGAKNNRRVLRALRDRGCPKKWLALPKDLEDGKQEAA